VQLQCHYSRTFDAASYLRAHGADTILTQHFLKDDVDTYINRNVKLRVSTMIPAYITVDSKRVKRCSVG
jgi:c-di-AMP phosphodiesterase-like protein